MTKIKRKTKETSIKISLNLKGQGKSKISTNIGFLNHMLESFSKHSLIDLKIKAKGDTYIDDHHTVEDIGIVLGKTFAKALYPIGNIERFGNSSIVMDEACVTANLDLSNRPFLFFDIPLIGKVGNFDTELVEEFFRAFTINSKITLHLIKNRGTNKHHIIEATFKALAVAIRKALIRNNKISIPSTKGII